MQRVAVLATVFMITFASPALAVKKVPPKIGKVLRATALLEQKPPYVEAPDLLVQSFQFNYVREPDLGRQIIGDLSSPMIAGGLISRLGLGPVPLAFGLGVARVINHSAERRGTEYRGLFRSPAGYAICRAHWADPSLNCNNTFSAVYHDNNPKTGQGNGIAYYAVVNNPANAFSGRCWIDGKINLMFVRNEKRKSYDCMPYGMCPWEEGPSRGSHRNEFPCSSIY